MLGVDLEGWDGGQWEEAPEGGDIYIYAVCAQSCSTLCDPMDCRLHGILQARILEWVAISSSKGSSQPRDQAQVSHVAGGFFYHLSHQGSPPEL